MTIQEAKAIILKLCDYEKRIVLRNILLVFTLIIALFFVLYKTFFPKIVDYIKNASVEIGGDSNFSNYYKYIIVFAFIVMVIYPIISLYKTINRKKKVEEVFQALENGDDIQIFDEETKYLTVIPLIYVKLNLNPITRLHIVIKNKTYHFPIDENYASDIKSSLTNVDLEKVNTIKRYIYGNVEVDKSTEDIKLKSIKEFHNFANIEFEDLIKNMEYSRKSTKSMFFVQVLFVLVLMGGLAFAIQSGYFKIENSNSIFKLIGIVIGISLVTSIGFMFYVKKKNNGNYLGDYTRFKKKVYAKLIEFINPNFEYAEKGHINLPEFLHSGMFQEKQYKINGSDQIAGIHNGIPFQSCNLSVTYRPQLRNEKEADDTVFYGNYFVAKFNKKFNYPIYIIPKKNVFGSMYDNNMSQYLDGSRIKINLEDPEFNKQFTVYCDDQVMARYVLTPAMMERIKKINTKSNGNLYIAINDQNILLATNQANASIDMNNIRNSMFQKLDMEVLHNLYEELYENIEVIDLLKLNINIWK